jgi:nicotinate-nucleotide adenylyltransferase
VARLGLLGGTFNPPHVGHLVCAQEALHALELDAVMLLPVAIPPHKEAPDDPGAQARLELCRLAARDEPGVDVSDLEVRRGGASYTVDTLRALHEAAPEDELTWLAGADMALSLPRWREPEAVLSLARFAVAERDGARREEIERVIASVGGRESLVFLDVPRLDVSSSAIRARVAAGRPIRHLVPAAVAEEIAARRLYRTRVAAP